MTQFQNDRKHWIFPFSVGVTNVQHVASLSLRFVFEKADEQCAEVKCCSCCPKMQHIHSKETEYQIQADIVEEGDIFTLTFLFYCQFRLCITTALIWAAAKAEAGKARTPLLKKIGDNYFEKANKNRNYINESYARAKRSHRRKGVLFLPNTEYVSARLRA